MITEPITIRLAQGEDLEPMALEALLHHLRRDGRAEIQMQGGKVPTACELALSVLRGFGVTVVVSSEQLEQMNQLMKDALV